MVEPYTSSDDMQYVTQYLKIECCSWTISNVMFHSTSNQLHVLLCSRHMLNEEQYYEEKVMIELVCIRTLAPFSFVFASTSLCTEAVTSTSSSYHICYIFGLQSTCYSDVDVYVTNVGLDHINDYCSCAESSI
jgi:hypothetical protein